ncbi:MAG: ABC transporter ATP-binding protein, partial [Eubacteriales bacterium]|nr:ABC transporter ATP-binding protein [Eubacteriales bacterium]
MEAIKFTDVNFTYPLCEKKALDNINLTVDMSEFIVLCGKSGCGKSTLLRHLKKNLTPYGYREGSVRYRGEEIAELDDRLSVSEIGYVQQNPDNQIVTDKVWHELAFGLESLGFDNASIRRRVAEMANFFDIQGWFRKSVTELSGGQKQLLNLASVMVMQPKVLILDEPAAQLDPIAASEFMRTLYRINRELGITVIISEHRLEELFPMADRVAVMDEGKIICCDSPRNVGTALAAAEHPMFYGLPAVMKIYARAGAGGECPMTIRDGRLWLESILGEPEEKACDKKDEKEKSREYKREKKKKTDEEYIIDARDVHFSYDRNSGEVLR